jgi:DNA-binding MarR family transcriptional regulator
MESHDVSEYTGYLIRRAQQAHVAAWQREVSSDFTSVQFGVLNVLSRSPGASQRALCTALDLDRSTIADIVARLERRGFIVRARDQLDRRRNILQLSPAGREELEAMIPRVARVDSVLTEGLDPTDRLAIRRILSGMLDSPSVRNLSTSAGL